MRIQCLFTLCLLIMATSFKARALGFFPIVNRCEIQQAVSDTLTPEDDLGLEYQIDYSSTDSSVVDVVNEQILLYGNARVVYGPLEVTGDFITFSLVDFTARAIGKRDSVGHVVESATFKEGESQFKEDSLAYNFK